MVLDMTKRRLSKIERLSLTVLASTLDGFLLTHRYLASDHDVISARDCPAGKLRAHCAIACNEHSCGYSSSSFMTACFATAPRVLHDSASLRWRFVRVDDVRYG